MSMYILTALEISQLATELQATYDVYGPQVEPHTQQVFFDQLGDVAALNLEAPIPSMPVKEILFILASPTLPSIVQYFASNGFSKVRSVNFSRWLSAASATPASALTAAELASHWPVLAGALELLQQEDSDETQS